MSAASAKLFILHTSFSIAHKFNPIVTQVGHLGYFETFLPIYKKALGLSVCRQTDTQKMRFSKKLSNLEMVSFDDE